jgi:hypothetical protein
VFLWTGQGKGVADLKAKIGRLEEKERKHGLTADEGDLLRRLRDDLAEAEKDKSDKSSKSGACDGECRAP